MESDQDRINAETAIKVDNGNNVNDDKNINDNKEADNDTINSNNKNQSKKDDESDETEILLASQMCSSCQREKAIIICNLCVAEATTSANSLDKIPTLKNQSNVSSNVEEVNVDSEQKLDGVYDKLKDRCLVEKLLKNGNLVYCKECFDFMHIKHVNHIPINLFEPKSNKTSADMEELKLEEIEEAAPTDLVVKDEIKPNEEAKASTEQNKMEVIVCNSSVTTGSSVLTNATTATDASDKAEMSELNIESLDNQINEINTNLTCLNKRCEQFNDVKQSIRQMNDLIKDDLYNDFGAIAVMMRVKLDEISDKIKERLKDAYSVIRDTQAKVSNKINEIKHLATQIEILKHELTNITMSTTTSTSTTIDSNSTENNELKLKTMNMKMDICNKIMSAQEQINTLNKELKIICDSQVQSESSTSFLLDYLSGPLKTHMLSTDESLLKNTNNLFPEFSYFVDTSKLIKAVNEIDIEIGSSKIVNIDDYLKNDDYLRIDSSRFRNGIHLDCFISDGLANDGTFWMQIISVNEEVDAESSKIDLNSILEQFKKNQQKINMLIEEINKFVRRKRIGDKEWQTYAEAERIPQVNENCFCLEPKSRKWLRAKIVSLDNSKALCKVRYMDTGNLETNFFTFDNLIIWKDFELSKIAPRAIRCALHKSRRNEGAEKYEKDICLETKYLFKDLTARQNLKCVLVEPLAKVTNETINNDNIYINESNNQTWLVKLYKPAEYKKLLENASLLSKDSIKDDNNNLKANESGDSEKTLDSKLMYEHNLSIIEPKSLNDLIIEHNEQELKNLANKSNAKSQFTCADIRVQSGPIESNFCMLKTGKTEEESTQQSSVKMELNHKDDAKDEVKLTSSHSIGQLTVDKRENSQSFDIAYKSLQFVPSNEQKQEHHELKSVLPSTSKNSIAEEESKSNVTLEISEVNESKLNEPKENENEHEHENILDYEDQTDDRREYSLRSGECFVNSNLNKNSVFWMKPLIQSGSCKYDELSKCIEEFINRTNYRSFSSGLIPKPNKKCFAKVTSKKGVKFYRGFIESVNLSSETCGVRLMDVGIAHHIKFFDIYPHRRLDDLLGLHSNEHKDSSFLKCKYLAIRCCLSADSKPLTQNSIGLFKKLLYPYAKLRFELIEQVSIDGVKCWVTYLYNNNVLVNKIILDNEMKYNSELKNSKDKFKLFREKNRLENLEHHSSSPNPSMSERTSSLSNREWLNDVETRELKILTKEKGRPKRASSLTEYNETDKSESEEIAKTIHGSQFNKEQIGVNLTKAYENFEKKSKDNRRRSKSVEDNKKKLQRNQQQKQENMASLNEYSAIDSSNRNEKSNKHRNDLLNDYYAQQFKVNSNFNLISTDQIKNDSRSQLNHNRSDQKNETNRSMPINNTITGQNFNQHQSLPYRKHLHHNRNPQQEHRGQRPTGDNANPRQNKPRQSNNSFGNCKTDGQFYNRHNRRYDDDDDNSFGGNGGGNRNGPGGSFRNQGNFGANRNNNGANSSGGGHHFGQNQGYRRHNDTDRNTPGSYLVMLPDDEFEQNSSVFNDVFIDEDNKINKTDNEDENQEYYENYKLAEDKIQSELEGEGDVENRMLLLSDEDNSRQIEELQYDYETIANLKEEQKLKDSANHYEKLSNIRIRNTYETCLTKPDSEKTSKIVAKGLNLNKTTCVYSILHSYDQNNVKENEMNEFDDDDENIDNRELLDLNESIEKQRTKTKKLSGLYKQLNKKYNYNDVVEFNSSSQEQLILDNTKHHLDQTQQNENLDSDINKSANNKNKNNLINESANSKVNDWLANKNNSKMIEDDNEEPQHKYEHLCDLNADIYDESLQNMFPQLIADTTSLDTVSDIMLDATTLDITQPVASRHAFVITNNQNIDISSYRSSRRNQFNLRTQYERLVEYNSEPKPRSFSADVVLLNRNQQDQNNASDLKDKLPSSTSDSSLHSLKKNGKKQNEKSSKNKNNEEDEDDYESYASCAEEIKSNSSHSLAGEELNKTKNRKISKERYFNGIKKSNDHKNGDIEFKYDAIKGIPSDNNTIQASLTAPNSKRNEKTGKNEKKDGNDENDNQEKPKKTVYSTNSIETKQQKIKKFTISVFVDSFEDYSFNKTLSESSTTLNSSPLNNDQAHKKINDDSELFKNRKRSSELISHHGSLNDLSKDFVDSSSNKRPSIDTFKTININKTIESNLISSNQGELKKVEIKSNKHHENTYYNDIDHSLKDFELNEARATASLKVEKEATTITNEQEVEADNKAKLSIASSKPYNTLTFQTPQFSDEAFMYDSNPNNYNTTKNALLASKPPLVPSSMIINSQTNLSSTQPTVVSSNTNNCLSTITECSNETFETCSVQSANTNRNSNNGSNQNQHAHTPSGDFDDEKLNDLMSSNENTLEHERQSKLISSQDKIDIDLKNVTLRRGCSDRKKNANQSEASNFNSAKSSRNNSSSGRENKDNSTNTSTIKQEEDSVNLKDILENLANNKEFRNRLKINRSSSNDNERTLNETNSNNLIRIDINADKFNFKSKSSSSLSDSCFTSTSSSNNLGALNLTASSVERPVSNRINQLIAALNSNRKSKNEPCFTYEDLMSNNNRNDSAKLTDKLFEKFCMISNDDIMNYASVNCLESLDLINSKSDSLKHKLTIKSNISESDKINSKLLNEILNEPVTPIQTDLEQNVFKFNINGDQVVSQTLASRYKEYIKCCKNSNNYIEPKNYFDIKNLIVDGRRINLNKNENDDGFDDQDEEDYDEVFLKSKPKVSNLVTTHQTEIKGELKDKNLNPKSASTPLTSDCIPFTSVINNKPETNTDSLNNNPKTSKRSSSSRSSDSSPSSNQASASTTSSFKSNRINNNSNNANNPTVNKSDLGVNNKTNISTPTTLEISSYTSDSLFNSHFIVTPMYSDAISPTQLGSLLLRSPLLQPMSPSKAAQFLNNNASSNTPKERRFILPSLNDDPAKPPFKSPTMPLLMNMLSPSFQNQQTPTLIPQSQSESIPSSSPPLPPPPPSPPADLPNSEPLPPPPPLFFSNTNENQLDFVSKFKNNLEKFNSNINNQSKPETQQVVTVKPKTSTSSLIESITARLNLMRSNEPSDNNKPPSLNNSLCSSNSVQQTNGIGSIFKNPLVFCKTTNINKTNLTSKPESAISDSTDIANRINKVEMLAKELNKNELETKQKENIKSSINQWTAANFSLYGLDNEDEQEVNNKLNTSNSFRRRSNSGCDYYKHNKLNSSSQNEQNEIRNLYPNLSNVDYNFDDDNNEFIEDENESLSNLPPPTEFQDSFNEDDNFCIDTNNNYKISKQDNINTLTPNQSMTNSQLTKSSLPPLPIISPNDKVSSIFYKLPSPPSQRELNEMKNKHNSTSSSVQTVIPNHTQTGARLSSFLRSLETDSHKNDLNSSIDVQKNVKTAKKAEITTNYSKHETNESSKLRLSSNASQFSTSRHYQSCPNLIDSSDFNDNESQSTKQSFKLDHLVDINPKRLYKNSKFRCKIHDVIDENGRFWLEVLYSKEDERKFFEIFKLFRLSSRISEPPRNVYINKRVSAMYKNDWHRAVVLDDRYDNNKVKVRFVDLGVIKILDKTDELREIDEKFFNCPLKALHCTINIYGDDEYDNDRFKLSKETRRFFTRLIYKKVLFAKVVEFITPISRDDALDANPICKIILGCQTHHGIIDVYMYLMSKCDRELYESIKAANQKQKKYEKNSKPLVQPSAIIYQSPSELYETANTSPSQHTPIQNSIPSPPLSGDALKRPTDAQFKFNEQITNNYYENSTTNNVNNNEIEVEEESSGTIGNESHDEDDDDDVRLAMSDNESYHNDRSDATDYALFSEIINYINNFSTPAVNNLDSNNQNNAGNKIEPQESSSTYFSADTGLDYTPVKGDTKNKQKQENSETSIPKKYNYGQLRIDSIHLSPIKNDDNSSKFNKTTPNPLRAYPQNENASTAVVSTRKRMQHKEFYNTTPIVLPLSRPLTINNYKYNQSNNNNNYSSDTDTSLQTPCCPVNPLKLKWNSGNSLSKYQGNRNMRSTSAFDNYHKTYSNNRHGSHRPIGMNEEYTETAFTPNYRCKYNNNPGYNNNNNNMQNNKKNVKFHLK